MQRPPGWLHRMRNGTREVVTAMRPHDHTAMFAPTRPVAVRRPADEREAIVLASGATIR